MSLLNDGLPLWEIAFRWTGRDPDRLWLRIPVPVRDNFRLMMDAILQGHLLCSTLSLEKRPRDSEVPPDFYIRHFIDDVYHCIEGLRFNRKLLRHAMIERWAMQQWCERQGIPLPEFWFPPGWKLHYEWQDPEDGPPEVAVVAETTGGEEPPKDSEPPTSYAKPQQEPAPPPRQTISESEAEGRRKLDQRQRRKIACQEVALRVWRKQPNADVKVVANSSEVQDLAGGDDSDFDVLLRWLGEIDPRDPRKRRGPKRKK